MNVAPLSAISQAPYRSIRAEITRQVQEAKLLPVLAC